MKHSRTPALLLLLAAPLLPACSDEYQEEAAAFADDAVASWDAIKLATFEQSSEFRAGVERGLRDLDRQLEEASARTGEAWAATRARLAEQRATLAAQLEELSAATAETWAATRDETVTLYENLRDAVQDALDQPE